jgi:hypothetical protein
MSDIPIWAQAILLFFGPYIVTVYICEALIIWKKKNKHRG